MLPGPCRGGQVLRGPGCVADLATFLPGLNLFQRLHVNHWSSEDERREQGKARTANISSRRDHGKSIKFRAPGAAGEAGATRTGGAAGAAAGSVSSGFMPVLVGTLSQPMLYFSKRQRNVIVRCGLSALGSYADHLPG